MQPANWFYCVMGEQAGPVAPAELRRLATAGIVTPDTPVRKGADGEWVSAGRLQGLFQPSGSPPIAAGPRAVSNPIGRPAPQRANKEQLEIELAPLANEAGDAAIWRRYSATGLIQSDELFKFYLSPFEAIQIEQAAAVEQPDMKAIRRAKERLKQAIKLDGKVSWLNDYPLDMSGYHAIGNELDDEAKRRYHWAIFQDERLLRFLTRGDIRHFLHSDDCLPRDTLKMWNHERGFRAFLSKPFAQQYNLVLTRAIERQLLPVVKALFDGRCWVETKDDDICFEGASKLIGNLVEEMRAKAKDGCARKVSLPEMEDFLRQHSLPELFNMLPDHFASYQRDVVEAILSLGIKCFNEHDDLDLSKGVLSLCKRFRFQNVELATRLEENFKTIERISEERTRPFSAVVHPGQTVHVTRAGIQFDGETINASEVEIIRWGIFIRTVNGAETEHSFSLVVVSADKVLRVEWGRRGLLGNITRFFRNKDEAVPIVQLATWAQQKDFEEMIDAVLRILVPPLLEKLVQRLQAGQTVVVGPCTLSSAGVAFCIGLLFQTDYMLPWRDVDTQRQSGNVYVFSRTNRNARVSMSAKDTGNAVVLPVLCATMREYTPTEQSQDGQEVANHQLNQESTTRVNLPALVFIAIIATIIIIGAIVYLTSTEKAPSGGSYHYASPSAPPPPAYSAPSLQDTPASESKTVYRVPRYMNAELDRDSQAIDAEKAKAERMAGQLESLGREIKQKELHLDQTSQPDIDEFNRKVDAYNGLVERARAQNRLVNKMVDSYNEKLRNNGR